MVNAAIGHMAQCLTHFSYEKSDKKLMLVDIQGSGYDLFDPEITSQGLLDGSSEVLYCAFCSLLKTYPKLQLTSLSQGTSVTFIVTSYLLVPHLCTCSIFFWVGMVTFGCKQDLQKGYLTLCQAYF